MDLYTTIPVLRIRILIIILLKLFVLRRLPDILTTFGRIHKQGTFIFYPVSVHVWRPSEVTVVSGKLGLYYRDRFGNLDCVGCHEQAQTNGRQFGPAANGVDSRTVGNRTRLGRDAAV